MVSLAGGDKQFFRSCFGLDIRETGSELSFCAYVVQSDNLMVVPDATLDARFQDNPLVTGYPHVRFYAGAPLRTPDGVNLGTLCVIDTEPRGGLTQGQTQMLFELAGMVMDVLEARRLGRTLSAERAFMRAVLDNVSDGIVACNAAGELTLFNQETRLRRTLPELPLPPDAWAEFYNLYEADGATPMTTERTPLYRAYRGETVKDGAVTVLPPQGTPHHLRVSGRPFYDPEGRLLGAVVAMRDVTDELAAQRALEEREAHHQLVMQLLVGSVRTIDTVARLGGDEFVVLLEGLSEPEDAEKLAARLVAELRTSVVIAEAEVSLGASIGVALPDAQTTGVALLERADAAMNRAKAAGKSGYAVGYGLAAPSSRSARRGAPAEQGCVGF